MLRNFLLTEEENRRLCTASHWLETNPSILLTKMLENQLDYVEQEMQVHKEHPTSRTKAELEGLLHIHS